MLECFDKERVCDSQDHVWSRERREERERERERRGRGRPREVGHRQVEDAAWAGHLRGLRACGELLELAVMDGEVGAVVAAELERLQAAVGWGRSRGGKHSQGCSSAPGTPSLCCPAYLIKASTISEDMAGEGARTTRGSPRSMSSHRVCTWVSTGWKHLCQAGPVREARQGRRLPALDPPSPTR